MINAILSSAPGAFRTSWPSVVAVIVVASAAFSTAPSHASRRKLITGVAISLSGLSSLAIALHDAGNPVNNLLTRDIVAIAFLGLTAPAVTALMARFLGHSFAPFRLSVSAIVGFAVISISPVLLLLVHCTSGDCL
jgi:hypothetical protein